MAESAETSGSDVETKARSIGWLPQEEFEASGKDGSKWRPAEEFVDFHERLVPVLKQSNRELKAQVDALSKKFDGYKTLVEKMGKDQFESLKKEYEAKEAYLKQQIKEARKVGDFETAERMQETLEEAQKGKPAPIEPPKSDSPGEMPPQRKAILDTWLSNNEWIKDPQLARYANSVGTDLQKAGPVSDDDYPQFLADVLEETKAAFPHKFKTKPKGDSVETGEFGGSDRNSKTMTYERLPTEARAECDDYVKRFGGKDKKAAQAEFVKLYSSYKGS